MNDLLTQIVLKKKSEQRIILPIRYWEAWSKKTDGSPYQLVDRNNSISILRFKYGDRYLYKAVR